LVSLTGMLRRDLSCRSQFAWRPLEKKGKEVMKSKLLLVLAAALASSTALIAQELTHDVDKAAKKTGHATKVASKDTARGTGRAAKDTGHATKIVAKDNADRTKLYATLNTIPASRKQSTDETVISFAERALDQPDAIKTWFYPGMLDGHEFVYGKREEHELA